MKTLSDALTFAGVPERIVRPADERFVTLKVKGRGAVQRAIKEGKSPVPFTGYRLSAGQFIYSRIDARNGAFAIVPDYLAGAVVSKDFPIFEINTNRVMPAYLIHFMKAGILERQIQAASFGATNRQRITEERLLSFAIALPSLDEQHRIAAILDRADDIHATRREVLTRLDALTQSIFHDMFGDPLSNDRGLPRVTIGSVAKVLTGNSPSRTVATNFGATIEWIKSDNLGGEVATNAEERLSELGRAKARVAPAGSVLVTCIAGSPRSIGKASLVDREVAFNQQINAVLPSAGLDTSFLLGQLKATPALVRLKSTGGMKGLVNKSSFQSIEILLPPREEQQEYVARGDRIRLQRAIAQRALSADDELVASLQSRAFRGEL